MTFIYKWNIMAGEGRKLMGVLAIRIGKDREIPFHWRDLTKGVENSILKQAKLK